MFFFNISFFLFSFQCWEECSKAPPGKISKTIRETWSLHTVSMVQQDSLVLVDVAWEQLSVPYQCLVTWEVSGGGLMGNLLTESFNVQLSLWPDTKYRVQVTCKNKLTGFMSRSLPLIIDTSEAVKAIETTVPQLRPTIRKQAIASYITNIPLPTTTIPPTAPPQPTPTFPTRSSAAKQAPAQFPVDNRADDDDIDTNVVPYDDQQSAETINQHTNFIFNWHMKKNSDISAIEPLHKTEQDILAVLANIHKPLLFGMTAGITLLMLLLMFFACPLRKPRLSSDKAMLMAEDLNAHGLTLPPALTASRSIGVTTRNDRIEHECKSPAMCSRDTLRVCSGPLSADSRQAEIKQTAAAMTVSQNFIFVSCTLKGIGIIKDAIGKFFKDVPVSIIFVNVIMAFEDDETWTRSRQAIMDKCFDRGENTARQVMQLSILELAIVTYPIKALLIGMNWTSHGYMLDFK
ncbi:uncharacterized protein LOC135958287 [Calliphora vicina]|uniref:uncharacterized protein LOC135958287 n=1 Tax=Calliphora vicina TaxID=7373 RepID=UPI00325B0ED3